MSGQSSFRFVHRAVFNAMFLGVMICLGALEAAAEELAAGRESTRALTSLIDFTPNKTQFQSELTDAVQPLEEAAALIATKHETEAKARYQEASKRAESLLKTLARGYHDELYFLLGFAREKLEDYSGAARAFEASLKLKRTNVLVLFRHAYVLQRSGKCEAALPEFREVLWQTRAEAHEVLYLQGECQLALGKAEDAVKSFEAARVRNSHFVPAVRRLVAARQELITTTTDPKLRTELERQISSDLSVISQQNPEDRDSSLQLAGMLLRGADPLLSKQRLKQAESLAKRFAESSAFADVKSVRLLFEAQRKQGDLAAAEQTLKRGLKASPEATELREAALQLDIDKGLGS